VVELPHFLLVVSASVDVLWVGLVPKLVMDLVLLVTWKFLLHLHLMSKSFQFRFWFCTQYLPQELEDWLKGG
jgi:hypothetical protein